MGLIRFRRPFQFTNKVKAAKLPEKLVDNTGKFVAVGVGERALDDPFIPEYPPRKIAVNGLSDEDCELECKKLEECDAVTISEDYICGTGKDMTYGAVCNGDSGGW